MTLVDPNDAEGRMARRREDERVILGMLTLARDRTRPREEIAADPGWAVAGRFEVHVTSHEHDVEARMYDLAAAALTLVHYVLDNAALCGLDVDEVLQEYGRHLAEDAEV